MQVTILKLNLFIVEIIDAPFSLKVVEIEAYGKYINILLISFMLGDLQISANLPEGKIGTIVDHNSFVSIAYPGVQVRVELCLLHLMKQYVFC